MLWIVLTFLAQATASSQAACLSSDDASCVAGHQGEGDEPALVQIRLKKHTLEKRSERDQHAAPADKKVWATTEWEQLREVIVGGAGHLFPGKGITWGLGAAAILPGEDGAIVMSCSGYLNGTKERSNWECCTGTPGVDEDPGCPEEPPASDHCCTYGRVEKEAKDMVAILEREGVKVHRVSDRLTLARATNNFGNFSVGPRGNGAMDIFPRDTQQVIQNLLIELDLGAPNRRSEILAESSLFRTRLNGSDAVHIAMPQHDWQDTALSPDGLNGVYNKHEYAVIEGGDVMLLGDTILIGVSDNKYQGSSMLGVQWLQKTLDGMGIEKKVVGVPLDQRVLHLDLVMSAPREGLVLIADLPSPVEGAGMVPSENERNTTQNGTWLAFPEGLPEALASYEKVHVSGLAGMYMGTNAIPVNQSFIIMANNSKAPANIQAEFASAQAALQKKGLHVETVDFWAHGLYGGAMRCSTHPLQRWDSK